jgi:hypothetical protein
MALPGHILHFLMPLQTPVVLEQTSYVEDAPRVVHRNKAKPLHRVLNSTKAKSGMAKPKGVSVGFSASTGEGHGGDRKEDRHRTRQDEHPTATQPEGSPQHLSRGQGAIRSAHDANETRQARLSKPFI